MAGPFAGIRVLDFTQYLAGPFAASKLGDLGADVIKVERPGTGDAGRAAAAGGARVGGQSPTFLGLNRSKRSLAVDLKHPDGRALAFELVRTADVLIENFRPGVMDRLGLGYEECAARRPGIVYVSASGYGEHGPLVARPGQDLLVQALSGLAANTGRAGDPPTAAGSPVADVTMAHLIAFAASTALYHRERTGEGQHAHVDLLAGMLDLQAHEAAIVLNAGLEPSRSAAGIANPYLAAPYGIYPTSDGAIAIGHTPMATLAELLDAPDLAAYTEMEDAFAERDAIYARVAGVLRERPTAEWLARLGERDVWCGEVLTLPEILAHEQVRANGMIVEVEHSSAGRLRLSGIPIHLDRTPGAVTRAAPLLGEHTVELLRELGCDEHRIDRLLRAGVVEECSTDALVPD